MNEEHLHILTRVIDKAVGNGWDLKWGRRDLTWAVDELAGFVLRYEDLYRLVFSHDFAKALWGEGIKPPEAEEIDDNHAKLGMYAAEGGGHEGYGDYTNLEFTGDIWQFHLQQMVVADDLVKYLDKNI